MRRRMSFLQPCKRTPLRKELPGGPNPRGTERERKFQDVPRRSEKKTLYRGTGKNSFSWMVEKGRRCQDIEMD